MHLTQGPPFPCCKALVTTSAVRPSQTFGERLPVIPGPLGALLEWGAVSASQEELNYFPLSPFHLHPSLLWRFCTFLWLWQKRKFWWVKCWRSFLNVWKNPRFVCRFLLSCFLWLFFSSLLCFTYCWGCLCSPDNHSWKCALQSCWFYICSQLADSSRILTCTDSYRYVEEYPAEHSLNPLLSLDPCCTFGVRNRSHFIFRIEFFLAPVSW